MPDPAEYGERVADIYDELFAHAPEAAVALLAELAGPGGRALELGIGTGRLALPLAARGVDVHGIDASQAMVARLRAKPGGDALSVAMGDFTDVGSLARGPFQLAFCAFNTFFALLTQEDQIRSFEGVASVLGPGGSFLVEVFVPDTSRFQRNSPILSNGFDEQSVFFEASRHDPASQRVSSRAVRLDERGARIIPIEIRYAYPPELDLMARLAGLRLAHRWSGWRREPFNAASGMHVSVWERPAE